jgi:hypothetical protein
MRLSGVIFLALACPVLAAETADRAKSPFDVTAPSRLQAGPLPAMVQRGERILRVHVWYGTQGRFGTDLVYVVKTHADRPDAEFSFEKHATWAGRDGQVQEARSDGTRSLSDAELAEFRAAFEPLRICSTGAEGKTGPNGWTIQIEFANETRHCFAQRWSPNWQEYAPEFVAMSEVLYGFAVPQAGAGVSGP